MASTTSIFGSTRDGADSHYEAYGAQASGPLELIDHYANAHEDLALGDHIIRTKYALLSGVAILRATVTEKAQAAYNGMLRDFDDARNDLNGYLNRCAEQNVTADPLQVTRLQQSVADTQAAQKRVSDESTAANKEAGRQERLNAAVFDYALDVLRAGRKIKLAKQSALPTDLLTAKNDAETDILAADAEEAEARARPERESEVAGRVTAALEARRGDGITLGSGFEIVLPMTDVGGHRAVDSVALALADERVFNAHLERLLATVKRRYAGVTNAVTTAERKSLIAAARAKRLTAERRLVQVVNALRAAGQNAYLPPNTDPRAVLGIEGPPPRQRR